ncbi:MAG: 4Fe-4S dicluster domain-containing protein [Methanobacteriota archaeon]|nr:MAG: 4Fe-4S dicluster domain-containing protein [Euryarchaeota archaeon]
MEIEHVKGKIMEGMPGFPRQYGPVRSDHQPGVPFFPQESARDFVLIFLLVAIMFFLSAVVTPFLGPARSPQISELIVPDWYLLFSWGLLKVADIFPQFTIGAGTPLKTEFSAAFWGDLLSGIPVIFLLILPFIDRGREARPAKSPVRSAFGIAFLIAWIFTASLYSIREVVAQRWQTPNGSPLIDDIAMKWFFVIPPVLVGLTSYIGLRRLGYQPMRKWLVPYVGGLTAIVAVQSAAILFMPGWLGPQVRPYIVQLVIFLAILLIPMAVASFAVFRLPESRARKWIVRVGVAGAIAFAIAYVALEYTGAANRLAMSWVLSVLEPSMNTLLLMPIFAVVTGYLGVRRPYSTYEYLLNECYQCGKCHTVCPVTKVEDDALGGLNLVYNTFKKQHDGVPLWTCLACDACSAVCPLDIQYSDYILEERSKVHARMAADGGSRE